MNRNVLHNELHRKWPIGYTLDLQTEHWIPSSYKFTTHTRGTCCTIAPWKLQCWLYSTLSLLHPALASGCGQEMKQNPEKWLAGQAASSWTGRDREEKWPEGELGSTLLEQWAWGERGEAQGILRNHMRNGIVILKTRTFLWCESFLDLIFQPIDILKLLVRLGILLHHETFPFANHQTSSEQEFSLNYVFNCLRKGTPQ